MLNPVVKPDVLLKDDSVNVRTWSAEQKTRGPSSPSSSSSSSLNTRVSVSDVSARLRSIAAVINSCNSRTGQT